MEANGQTIGRHTRVLSVVGLCFGLMVYCIYVFYKGNFICFNFRLCSFLQPPTHALLTLASFRNSRRIGAHSKERELHVTFFPFFFFDAYTAGHV